MTPIGVVVPAYQAEKYLEATLVSIQGQTMRDWKCVVVDDGSVDATADVARRFVIADSRFSLHQQSNRGLCGARHAGIAECLDCEAVIFVDSDDTLEVGALQALWDALDRRTDAVGVSGLADYMDEDGNPTHPGEHPSIQRARLEPEENGLRPLDYREDTTFRSLTVEGRIWPTAVALIRVRAAISAGLFDERMVPQEDWEFYLRLTRLGPLAYLDERVAWYRRHAGNATNNAALAALSAQQRLRATTFESRQTSPTQRDAIALALRHKRSWEMLRHARLAKAALVRRRPVAACWATACVALAAMSSRSRPHVSPPWVVNLGVKAREKLRESGLEGTDDGHLIS